MANYFVFTVEVPSSLESWVGDLAFDFGAMGTTEVLKFSQPEGEETVFTESLERKKIEIYFADSPSPEFFVQIETRIPTSDFSLSECPDQDWMAEWKKNFKPMPLAEPFWIVPSWEAAPPMAAQVIHMDPGMAFGTGTHETTQLIAEELVAGQVGYSLLDVGTGTGILAILAIKLGFKEVCAIDTDPEARRVAQENFELNSAQIELPALGVHELKGTYSVVVANIIDGPLVRMQHDLFRLVEPGGRLVVSGILLEREREFLQHFLPPPGRPLRRTQKGDWLAFTVSF